MFIRGAAVRALRRSALHSSSSRPPAVAPLRFGRTNALAAATTTNGVARSALRSLSSRTSFDLPDPSALMSYNESTHPTHPDDEVDISNKRWHPQLTKIVATIGPTSEQFEPLQEVVRSGMRVMRLNFSHATVEEVELRCGNLARCQGRHGKSPYTGEGGESSAPNVRAVLLDTRGPEIRTGKLQNDHSGKETVPLQQGDTITLHTSDEVRDTGSTSSELYIDYSKLAECLEPGMKVLLDDGAVVLTVESCSPSDGTVSCIIGNSGSVRSRAGVNLPGAETDLPAMSEKDRIDIKYGMTKDVDFVAASFVQNAEGVREIRSYMEECAAELGWDTNTRPLPLIISKIESVSALRHFDAILDESDGIMVARGDLGVEIPIQQVVNAQKEMVAACNAAGKPVVVATQMLESMGKNPRPTRAEVSDVTNAVYDGADAVMLSGETAKGKYPIESVRMMNEIIYGAEKFAAGRPDLVGPLGHGREKVGEHGGAGIDKAGTPVAAAAKAAVTAASERDAAAILVLTDGGGDGHAGDDGALLPRLVSAYRPDVPVVAFCPDARAARRLQLHRGVHPVVMGTTGDVSTTTSVERCAEAIRRAEGMGLVSPGEDVICVMTENDGDGGEFSTMKVAKVPGA